MSIIEKMLRWVVLAGVFALPFIVFIISQTLFFPYITGKNFSFRILVEIISGAWLALALVLPEYRPRRSWLLAAFSLFVIIVAIADAQGVYPFKSFWSNYERMDGWVTLAHLFAYFVVAASMLNTEKLWRALFNVSLAASVVMGLYGLLQIVGITSLAAGFSSATRIDATFGNPIYLAAYMLFHVFIAAMLLVRTRAERIPGSRLGVTLWYGSVIVFDTLILCLTGTRGTMLGLVGGALLALVLFAVSSGSKRAWKIIAVIVVGLAVFAGALFIGKDTPLVRNVSFLNRLSTISIYDDTVKARFLNWGMALKGVEERPLLGWGQENYAIVFDKYYDPRMYSQEQWFDRVHNIIFDWLVAAGIIGLVSYLSLFAAALWGIWRGTSFTPADRSILTGLLAAYFFHDLFVFDNISSYLLFATVLAYVAWRAGESAQHRRIADAVLIPREGLPIVAAVAVLAVWGTASFVNAAPLAANAALLQAMAPQKDGITKNLDYFKQAVAYGSFGTQEVREQLIQGAAQLASKDSVPDSVKQAFLQIAASEMDLMQKASPLDARFPLFEGVLYEAYGMHAEAATALERAHQLSPTKQTILYELGNNRLTSGDTSGALDAFKQAFEVDEHNPDARVYYAALLIRAGQEPIADQILAPIIPTGEAADTRIASAYFARNELSKAIPLWQAHLKVSPSDSQAYFTLAALYYQIKDNADSIATLEAAKTAIPSAADQADALIAQVKSGTVKMQ